MNQEIPKIIHYCWFGKKPLSEMAVKCIKSWEKFFPDYEIKQWNEDNFDVNSVLYLKNAYKEKKWAYVSDYVRLRILYDFGGIYFDTDVEVIRSFEDIIENGNFCGFEREGKDVALGLGFGVEKHNFVIGQILDTYTDDSFYDKDGQVNCYNTIVLRTNKVLKMNGLINIDNIQNINGLNVYPKRFFCPMNYETGEIDLTEDTYSIHWYEGTWMPIADLKIHEMEQKIRKKYKKISFILCYIYRKGYRLKQKLTRRDD